MQTLEVRAPPFRLGVGALYVISFVFRSDMQSFIYWFTKKLHNQEIQPQIQSILKRSSRTLYKNPPL